MDRHFLLQGIFLTVIEPGSPTLQADSLLSKPPGKALIMCMFMVNKAYFCSSCTHLCEISELFGQVFIFKNMAEMHHQKFGRDFPSNPVVKTPCSHCRGTVSIPGQELMSCMQPIGPKYIKRVQLEGF